MTFPSETTNYSDALYQQAVAETIDEIAQRLDVDKARAEHLWNAMGEVYDLMSETGMCDSAGGTESMRVVPDALEFIRHDANLGPDDPDPAEVMGWGDD